MDVRLVAYRRETTASGTYDVKNYELDLQKNPNVVVNYNFLDLQKPENRKTNFSQTLKLPFSNANNQFFEIGNDAIDISGSLVTLNKINCLLTTEHFLERASRLRVARSLFNLIINLTRLFEKL